MGTWQPGKVNPPQPETSLKFLPPTIHIKRSSRAVKQGNYYLLWYRETPFIDKQFIVLQQVIVQAIPCPRQPTSCNKTCKTTKIKDGHCTKNAYEKKKTLKTTHQTQNQPPYLVTLKSSGGQYTLLRKAINRGKGSSFTPAGGKRNNLEEEPYLRKIRNRT